MDPFELKKNLLDLSHTENLQYYNTAVIVLFTYFVGIIIAVMTRQIQLNNYSQIGMLIFVSVPAILIPVILIKKHFKKMKQIKKEIQGLIN